MLPRSLFHAIMMLACRSFLCCANSPKDSTGEEIDENSRLIPPTLEEEFSCALFPRSRLVNEYIACNRPPTTAGLDYAKYQGRLGTIVRAKEGCVTCWIMLPALVSLFFFFLPLQAHGERERPWRPVPLRLWRLLQRRLLRPSRQQIDIARIPRTPLPQH